MTCAAAFKVNGVVAVKGRTAYNSGTIPTGAYPLGVAVNESTDTLYVTCSGAGALWGIDAATGKELTIVPLGLDPRGVAYLGHTIYVANTDSSSICVITTPSSWATMCRRARMP